MNQEDYISPIELYNSQKQLRPFLLSKKIIKDEGFCLSLPGFKVKIDKDGMGKDVKTNDNFPFYHQKFMFLIDAFNGDWRAAVENWTDTRAFTAPNGKLVSLIK